MTIKVEQNVKIKIKGQHLELTGEEAQYLYDQLEKLMGKKHRSPYPEKFGPSPYKYDFPDFTIPEVTS